MFKKVVNYGIFMPTPDELFWIGPKKVIKRKSSGIRQGYLDQAQVYTGEMRFVVYEGSDNFGLYRKNESGGLKKISSLGRESAVHLGLGTCVSLLATPAGKEIFSKGKVCAVIAHIASGSEIGISQKAIRAMDHSIVLGSALTKIRAAFPPDRDLRFVTVPGNLHETMTMNILKELEVYCKKNKIKLEAPVSLTLSAYPKSVVFFRHPKRNWFGFRVSPHRAV